jgi:antitoxin YefM
MFLPRGYLFMEVMTYSSFREKLAKVLDSVSNDSLVVKITRQNGKAAVIMSLEDWERDQETLYVLQNKPLMRQIAESFQTHQAGAGHVVSKDVLDEIIGV